MTTSLSGVLNTALDGLSRYQQALATTSNNISNVNTVGYSVQTLDLSSLHSLSANNLPVSRQYNQFLTAQVRSSTSAYNNSNTYYTLASQVDNMLADQNTGLSSSMSAFFNAANGVANDPTSIPARQVMLSNGQALANQFNSIAANFTDLRSQVNGNLNAMVTQLNSYAGNVALLNHQIVGALNNGTGQPPNDLLDQRDYVLNQIAQLADISVVQQSDGSVNVNLGQGQPLVVGKTASTLSVQSSATDPSHMQVMLNGKDISTLISGGQIAGNLQFRDQVLDPAQQQLGLLATGLATQVNTVHQVGLDLNGNAGLPLFNLLPPSVNSASIIEFNPALTTPQQIAAASAVSKLPGDNSNALELAKLQTKPVMNSGTSTFSQAYGQLVAGVGNNTNYAQLTSSAQNTVLQNATASQQSISGVNLDEEASKLIMYQNAYQASAKTVAMVKTLFDSILNVVG